MPPSERHPHSRPLRRSLAAVLAAVLAGVPARLVGRRRPTSAGPDAESLPLVFEPGCSDVYLCWLWQQTFRELQATRHAAGLLRLSRARAEILDELDRRHPERLANWLAGDSRPGGDPAPYLRVTP